MTVNSQHHSNPTSQYFGCDVGGSGNFIVDYYGSKAWRY